MRHPTLLVFFVAALSGLRVAEPAFTAIAADDPRIAIMGRVDLSPEHAHTDFQPGTPTDTHPVAFQHEQIALDFLGPIREVTGW